MSYLKQLFTIIIAFFTADEEIVGLHIYDFVQALVKPFVFAYVCGTYVYEFKTTLVQMIEPKTPDFSTEFK